jgi:hypothetical protein
MALLDHVKNRIESVRQTRKRTKGSGGPRTCYATGARPGFPKNFRGRWDPTETSLMMGHCGKRKANFEIILDLTHDSRHIRQVAGTGNGKTLNDGVVKRVIENRVHRLLIRRGQAGKPMSLVFRLTYAALYKRDVATEHFSNTEHARTLAEWGPERRLCMSTGRLGGA